MDGVFEVGWRGFKHHVRNLFVCPNREFVFIGDVCSAKESLNYSQKLVNKRSLSWQIKNMIENGVDGTEPEL